MIQICDSSLYHQRHVGRVLRSSCNVIADEDLHRHAPENIAQADALLFGRATYEMVVATWRSLALAACEGKRMAPRVVHVGHVIFILEDRFEMMTRSRRSIMLELFN